MSSTATKNKMARDHPLQNKYTSKETIQMLNQLSMCTNITVKRKLLLQNCSGTDLKPNQQMKPLDNQNTNKTTQKRKLTKIPITQIPTNILQKQQIIKIPENVKLTKILENLKAANAPGNQKLKKSCKVKGDSAKRLCVAKNKEFYPEKHKRKVRMKKVVLQPKHDYKVVAVTNKRKRRTPQKEIEPTPVATPSPLPSGEMSLSELVALAEDQGLDDEDFMEILTCPSPVWWEEHSDEEEEIRISFAEDLNEVTSANQRPDSLIDEINNKITTDANANQISVNNTKISNKSGTNLFKKIYAKRSKLENVLSNIKFKKSTISTVVNEGMSVGNDDIVTVDEKDLNKRKNILKKSESSDEIVIIEGEDFNNEKITALEDMHIHNDNEIGIENNIKNRNDSVGALSDVSINDDFINILETMEIPVRENYDTKECIDNEVIIDHSPNKSKEGDEILIENIYQSKKRIRKPNKKYEFELKEQKNSRIKKRNLVATNEINVGIVPTDLPPLTKSPFKKKPRVYQSPKFVRSPNSESTNSSVMECDSISDTNIKFLDEYVDAKKEQPEDVNVKKYGQDKDGELVTVYQIVNNKAENMDLDIESQIKVNLVNKSPQTVNNAIEGKNSGQIDDFYKTRKRTYRSKSKYKKV